MADTIDYGNLMHQAMRSLIRRVLTDVSKDGLPGDHHFFIIFNTLHPDVEIADWLSDRYPEEMTIVIQYWFENLSVSEDGFTITLSFGDRPEPMYIPFDAIKTFVDPSVELGLHFDSHDGDTAEDDAPMAEDVDDDAAEEETKAAEVVSLDKFRK